MPETSSSRNIQKSSAEHLLLAAILQGNYSVQLRLQGERPKLLELLIWNALLKDKWTKQGPRLSFCVVLCVSVPVLVFMCKAVS